MNLEKAKKYFQNHIATFTDCGNIKILDFKNPDSPYYRIRFLFEEEFYKLHISGDLGELTATSNSNMTWEKFSDFVNNTGYFKGKINCHSRVLDEYDKDLAKEQLREKLADADFTKQHFYDFESEDENREAKIDEILYDFDETKGLSFHGCTLLREYDRDCWEYANNIGKKDTGILDLYMLAFKMAKEQLEGKVAL